MPEPLPIESVNHIGRITRDLDKSLVFYRDVLGFRQMWRPNFTFPGAWLYNYGVYIHLIATGEGALPDPADIANRTDHVALQVADIEKAIGLLEEHGIPFRSRTVPDTGVKQVFIKDPDGNHIELGMYPPPRP